jgi:hypothetical protein
MPKCYGCVIDVWLRVSGLRDPVVHIMGSRHIVCTVSLCVGIGLVSMQRTVLAHAKQLPVTHRAVCGGVTQRHSVCHEPEPVCGPWSGPTTLGDGLRL